MELAVTTTKLKEKHCFSGLSTNCGSLALICIKSMLGRSWPAGGLCLRVRARGKMALIFKNSKNGSSECLVWQTILNTPFSLLWKIFPANKTWFSKNSQGGGAIVVNPWIPSIAHYLYTDDLIYKVKLIFLSLSASKCLFCQLSPITGCPKNGVIVKPTFLLITFNSCNLKFLWTGRRQWQYGDVPSQNYKETHSSKDICIRFTFKIAVQSLVHVTGKNLVSMRSGSRKNYIFTADKKSSLLLCHFIFSACLMAYLEIRSGSCPRAHVPCPPNILPPMTLLKTCPLSCLQFSGWW